MDSDRRSAAVVRELGLERVAVIGRILDVVVHGEEGAVRRLSREAGELAVRADVSDLPGSQDVNPLVLGIRGNSSKRSRKSQSRSTCARIDAIATGAVSARDGIVAIPATRGSLDAAVTSFAG